MDAPHHVCLEYSKGSRIEVKKRYTDSEKGSGELHRIGKGSHSGENITEHCHLISVRTIEMRRVLGTLIKVCPDPPTQNTEVP